MKETISKSILAGLLIGLAGWIYLKCLDRTVGSILFSIGLSAVIVLKANLFTGKIGYVNSVTLLKNAIVILVFNILSAYIVGLLYCLVNGPSQAFDSRLSKPLLNLFIDAIGCGMLIYLAVELYSVKQNVLFIILPVVAFILSGMEHSIADAFYFGTCQFSVNGSFRILVIAFGNAIGSLIIRQLQVFKKGNE